MKSEKKVCPDCQHDLQPIKMLDATSPGYKHEGVMHTELAYAAPDAAASFFLHAVPKAGVVKAWICPECGRILLYGQAL